MIIDHVGLLVSDYEASKHFYSTILAPLGATYVRNSGGWAGFGGADEPEFWIGPAPKGQAAQSVHVAFKAPTRAMVRRVRTLALSCGGTLHEPKEFLKDYDPYYYAAFVRDPDGHIIEIVCREADAEAP